MSDDKRSRNLVFNSTANDWPDDLFPSGRCRFSYRTKERAKAQLYKETINRLRSDGEYDILKACQEEALRIDEVHAKLTLADSRSDALDELRAEMRQSGFRSAPTFGEVVDKYLDQYSTTQAVRTARGHRLKLEKFGRQELDGQAVSDHQIDRLDQYQLNSVLQDLDVSPSTAETYRRNLSGLYTWYMDWELAQLRTKGRPRRVEYNPAAEIERRKTGGDITTLNPQQMRAVLAACRPHERALFRLYAELGLRAKEAVHLRKDADVKLDEGIIKIQPRGPDPEHKCPDCQADGWSPKRPRSQASDNNSIRDLHLPEEKSDLLEELRRHAELWPVDSGEYFFQNPSPNSAGPWTYESVRYRFKRACEETDGIVTYGQSKQGGVTLHSLRHTAATEMIRNGVPLSVAAKVLGHTVATLENIYEHLLDEDTRIGLKATPSYGATSEETEGEETADNGDNQSAPQSAPDGVAA